MKKLSLITIGVIAALQADNVQANSNEENESTSNATPNIEHIQILGRSDKLNTESGSNTLIDELSLEKMEYDDIHRVLAVVPGINIRQEDGYGLRPNIGFRGVTPERSKKINILEDGVLIGPAPYSAPAAYYFPSVNLMTSVEVFKGPAAILYGPNTVAGTLNMTTRSVPDAFEGQIDLGLGSNGYQKFHGFTGNSFDVNGDSLGVMVEYLSTAADGFKDIDVPESSNLDLDSGFDKTDVLAKINYRFDGSLFESAVQHYIELKVSQSEETSDETYMGLTAADFEATPYRRYAASQVGNMDWNHSQLLLTYNLSGNDFSWTNRLYNNEFERAWRKVNGFNTSTSLQEIMADPEAHENFYQVMTGYKDSESIAEVLIVGTNDRSYYSRGVQSDLTLSHQLFDVEQVLKAGVRFHNDKIDRDHFEQAFVMRSGLMEASGQDAYFTTVDYEKSDTISLYAQDTLVFEQLELSAGVRGEIVDSRYQNRSEGQEQNWLEKSSETWLYSVSGFYTLNDTAGLFFGVHEGYVPTSPKQAPAILPEESVNYELGGRYNDGTSKVEAVLFFNDFSNLKESCSFSTSSSCAQDGLIDQEYNGGEVEVVGLEFTLNSRLVLTQSIDLPYSVTYTHTESEFKQALNSTFELWGNIEAGDPLPYLPSDQLTVSLGLDAANWQVNLLVKYIGEMHETAGSDVAFSGQKTDALTVLDLTANYRFNDQHSVYFKADNLLDEVALVSSRPFGARPSKPQQFFAGYKYQF